MKENVSFSSLLMVSFFLFKTECVFSETDAVPKSYETSSNAIENLYDKIYVISLDCTPERYAYVKKQLDKFNLKHERFSAVDGKSITVKDMGPPAGADCRYVASVCLKCP